MDQETIIRRHAEAILHYLEQPEISELCINQPGEIWLKHRAPLPDGDVWTTVREEKLTYSHLTTLAYMLANAQQADNFGPHGNPTLFGNLPGSHRFALGFGPNFQYEPGGANRDGTFVLAARQWRPSVNVDLDAYHADGAPQRLVSSSISRANDPADIISKLTMSIARRDHILLSGATDTGKTTLMNELLRRYDSRTRIVTIEDTSEIVLNQKNRVHIVLQRGSQSNDFSYSKAIDLIVRMTPDIVVAGEISTRNAPYLYDLSKTGHGGFMTTIHAEDVDEAISSFVSRMAHERPNVLEQADTIKADIRDHFRIVQMRRTATGQRHIVQVV